MGRRFNLIIGSFLTGLVLAAAVVSLFWQPHDPNAMDFSAQLSGPTANNWLGADHYGRDLFSRLLIGARGTMYVGFISVGIALTIGGLLGAFAGYVGGLIGEGIMRVVDVLYAFPAILMALLLAAIYEPGTVTAMVAIGIATIPIFARIMRSSVISLRELEFVEAGRALGLSHARILWRHVVPGAFSPVIVQASLSLSVAVLAEAALSFLGLGTPPQTPSWGSMLREAQSFLAMSPYPAFVPGIAIMLTVLGLSLLGDGLRDMADRRSG